MLRDVTARSPVAAMKLKVLIADELSPAAIDKFYKNSIATTVADGLSAEELRRVIGEYHGLACAFQNPGDRRAAG